VSTRANLLAKSEQAKNVYLVQTQRLYSNQVMSDKRDKTNNDDGNDAQKREQ